MAVPSPRSSSPSDASHSPPTDFAAVFFFFNTIFIMSVKIPAGWLCVWGPCVIRGGSVGTRAEAPQLNQPRAQGELSLDGSDVQNSLQV